MSGTNTSPKSDFLPQVAPLIHKLIFDISQSLQTLGAAVKEAELRTEADLAAARVAQAESCQYQDFFELAPDAYLVTDPQMAIQKSNQMAATILQMDRDFLKNKPLTLLIMESDRPALQAGLSQVWTEGQKRDWKLHLEPGKSPAFPVYVNVRAQMDHQAEPTRLLWLIRDARERQEEEGNLRSLVTWLQNGFFGLVETLAHAVEMKYLQNAGHQRRVAELAVAIGQEMGFSSDRLRGVKVAALLHDIGKIAVPTEILNKPGTISNLEAELIKSHCQVGFDLLQDIDFPWPVQQAILQHHERLDGSGYPAGLMAADIIPEAKILAVADVLDAMTHNRPEGPAQSLDTALEEIDQHRGVLYDPEVVNVCLTLFKKKAFKFTEDFPAPRTNISNLNVANHI